MNKSNLVIQDTIGIIAIEFGASNKYFKITKNIVIGMNSNTSTK